MNEREGNVQGISLEIERPLTFRLERRGKKKVEAPSELAVSPVDRAAGNTPRAAKLLALAHRFERLVREGVVRDYADLARLGGVSRARMSQIMDLLLLAPEIQEDVLGLPRVTRGGDPVAERHLRKVVRKIRWEDQRREWEKVRAGYEGRAERRA
jgi:hypothetical protein